MEDSITESNGNASESWSLNSGFDSTNMMGEVPQTSAQLAMASSPSLAIVSDVRSESCASVATVTSTNPTVAVNTPNVSADTQTAKTSNLEDVETCNTDPVIPVTTQISTITTTDAEEKVTFKGSPQGASTTNNTVTTVSPVTLDPPSSIFDLPSDEELNKITSPIDATEATILQAEKSVIVESHDALKFTSECDKTIITKASVSASLRSSRRNSSDSSSSLSKIKSEKVDLDQQQVSPLALQHVSSPAVVVSMTPSRSRSSSQSSKSSKTSSSPGTLVSPGASGKAGKGKGKRRPPPPKEEGLHDGRNDFYCWICHKEGEVLCCELCPRVFHTKCLNLHVEPEGDWFCPECDKITVAECKETQSRAMSMLNIDLLALHLRYALQRMKTVGFEPFLEPVDTKQFSDYLDYVFHPMDLSTLEKKIKNRVYGCTEAFVADAKWILHNCIIYNGMHTKLTQIAKTIVKIAEHEMSEIEVCPECYLNACRKRENWFCEPCRNPHVLVWAKLQGFPHWPAKALRIDKGAVDARFFGQHDRAWIPISGCYLMSKEMPFPVKNKKKAGAKGGLENAMAEAQLYVDNVTRKFGQFEYAQIRTPLTHIDIYQRLALNHSVVGAETQLKNEIRRSPDKKLNSLSAIDVKREIEEMEEAESRSPAFKQALGASSAGRPKKSKVVTTSGEHPAHKAGRAARKHASMLDKTIESCTASLLESIQNESDDETSSTEDSETSEKSFQDSNATNLEKEQAKAADGNAPESGSELAVDDPAADSKVNKKEKGAKVGGKKTAVGGAGLKRKLTGGDESSSKMMRKTEGEVKPLKLAIGDKQQVQSLKQSIDASKHASSAAKIQKIGAGAGEKAGAVRARRESATNLFTPPPSSAAGNTTAKKYANVPARKKGFGASSESAEDKVNLKSAAKILSEKVMKKKTDPTKTRSGDKKSDLPGARRLSSFTIPKHKVSSMIQTSQASRAGNDGDMNGGKEVTSSSNHASFNVRIQKYTDTVMSSLQQVIAEMYDDVCSMSDGGGGSSKEANLQQQHQKQLSQLRLQMERMKWTHQQEVAELQHNHDLAMAEIRHSVENEKQQQLGELRRKCERDKQLAVEQTKRKQWCANCGKAAIFYCCWNTSYCDYPCQQLHWPKHMNTCSQAARDQASTNAGKATGASDAERAPSSDKSKECDESEDDAMMVIDEESSSSSLTKTMPCMTSPSPKSLKPKTAPVPLPAPPSRGILKTPGAIQPAARAAKSVDSVLMSKQKAEVTSSSATAAASPSIEQTAADARKTPAIDSAAPNGGESAIESRLEDAAEDDDEYMSVDEDAARDVGAQQLTSSPKPSARSDGSDAATSPPAAAIETPASPAMTSSSPRANDG